MRFTNRYYYTNGEKIQFEGEGDHTNNMWQPTTALLNSGAYYQCVVEETSSPKLDLTQEVGLDARQRIYEVKMEKSKAPDGLTNKMKIIRENGQKLHIVDIPTINKDMIVLNCIDNEDPNAQNN